MPRTALTFSLLIYPFRQNLFDGNNHEQLRDLSHRWKPWWSRLVGQRDGESLKRALDDTYFFMPYICKLLFPETECIRPGRGGQELEQEFERARQLADLNVDQLVTKVDRHGMVRLTYDAPALAALSSLQLDFGESFSAAVKLSWVDVALFPQQVGFLILKAHLDEPDPTTEKLNDFLYHVRFVHPPKLGWRLAHWNLTTAGTRITFSNQELIEFLLQGFAEGSTEHSQTIDEYLTRRSKADVARQFSTTEEGQVFGQTLREYSYACLEASPESPSVPDQPENSIFDSLLQRVAYELVTCTDTSEADYKPHPTGLAELTEEGRVAIWANWEGIALHDNVVFLASVATPFTRGNLAENIENDYFYLYLLALYQKMRLTVLSGELMRQTDDLYNNLKEARVMVDRFVEFRNHYWFANVTFKPQGTTIYQQFQRGLGVKSLYDSVSKEVSELENYYERRADRRRESLLFFLTFIGLPAGLLAAIFGPFLFAAEARVEPNRIAWMTFGASAAFVYALSAVIYFIWKRWRR